MNVLTMKHRRIAMENLDQEIDTIYLKYCILYEQAYDQNGDWIPHIREQIITCEQSLQALYEKKFGVSYNDNLAGWLAFWVSLGRKHFK